MFSGPSEMSFSKRSSGVLLHITSLPGPHGIGDLGPDAYRFADWLALCGQGLWQILPTTPIGPGDSPYQSVSAFAGSPLMVALEPLIARGWMIQPEPPEGGFVAERVDFDRVVPWRMKCLRRAALGFFTGADAIDLARFEAWARAHAGWLDDYSMFMTLETLHGGAPWWSWQMPLRQRNSTALDRVRANHDAEIRFWRFVQWCFDEQFMALKAYANSKGIRIVGDLPIFVAHHSADCWMRPDLYVLDDTDQPPVVAGVPPDALALEGQRWGNPLYCWESMAADGFKWWIDRIHRVLDQVDIFRIDHFRGFASYYEIPASCTTAKEGRWVAGPGRVLFNAIEKALGKLPIIAEDLGFITSDVIDLRDAFGFPGMRILQFGFGADANHEFLPHNYVPTTVAYTGTHDNDTVLGWWQSAPENERAYAGCYLAATERDIHWAMIRAASNSVAQIAIFPMQDVLGLDGRNRMNVPGTATGNWHWRFDWSMVGDEPGRVLGLMTAASGRGPFELMTNGRS